MPPSLEELFCGNLMFMEDFSSIHLKLRCSVVNHRTWITKVLAVDKKSAPRAKAPGDHTVLVSRWLAFLLLLVWSCKVPSYGSTETAFMYTFEKTIERKSCHYLFECINFSHSLSHVVIPELLLPLERWCLQQMESNVLYYFQLKGVIHDGKTFVLLDLVSSTKLLEDFRGEKRRETEIEG